MRHLFTAIAFVIAAFSAHATEAKNIVDYEKHPDMYCLALNVYYEARGSNLADQAAVADVVMNRVRDTRYPNTICDVVYQAKTKPSWKTGEPVPIRNQCQFSWYCDGKPDIPAKGDAWVNAQQVAYLMVYLEQYRGITEGATHYHADYVKPRWARDFQLVGRIGEHIFYRWE